MPPSDVAMALAFPLLGPLPDLGLQFRHLRSDIMISYSFFLENIYWGPLCFRQLEDKVLSIPSGSHGWEETDRSNKRSVPNRPSTGLLVSTEEGVTDCLSREVLTWTSSWSRSRNSPGGRALCGAQSQPITALTKQQLSIPAPS